MQQHQAPSKAAHTAAEISADTLKKLYARQSKRSVHISHPFLNTGIDHPFIVLSARKANDLEKTFVCVMITSSENTKDDFSFELTDAMFEKPLKSRSHLRMHLTITAWDENEGRHINIMKAKYSKN